MPPISLRRVHRSGEKDLSLLLSRKRSPEEALQDIDTSLSSSTPVILASGQANIPLSPTISVLPPFQATFAPCRGEGRSGTGGDGERFLLYQIAAQYGLEGAIPGKT